MTHNRTLVSNCKIPAFLVLCRVKNTVINLSLVSERHQTPQKLQQIFIEERKTKMKKTAKEILNKISQYAEQNKELLKSKIEKASPAFIILILFCGILHLTNGFNGFIAERPLNNITNFTVILTIALLYLNVYFNNKIKNTNNAK